MPDLDLPPIIPREDLFGNPEKASPQISPDGTRLAYLAPDEGVLNAWIRTPGQRDDRAVTRDRNRGIRSYLWAFDRRHLLYIQDRDGDENWHIWSVDLVTGDIVDLTPYPGVQAQVVAVDHRFPNEILVGLNQRDPTLHDVHRIDLATGQVTMEVENPGDIVGWVVDSKFHVRGAHAAMPDGGFQLRIRDSLQGEWRPLVTWGPDEEGAPYGFTPDDRGMYIGTSLGANTEELRLLDTLTGDETTLAANPTVDLGEVLVDPSDHHIQAVAFDEDRLQWRVLDPAVQADFDLLASHEGGAPGELHIVSRSQDDHTWIVLFVRDNAPARYYEYNRSSRAVEFLFSARPALERQTLASMEPLRIGTRDGLTLHCYLTLPPGAGATAKDLPLVLNVHGGPWARDHWGYDPEAQWLANRGYACLQVNFRGSSGFGKAFLHAGDREWGARMHDDLIDAVNWAVDRGIADPQCIGIFGGSYGGYAALVGAAFTPDVFACAIDVVGPSSLRTLINSIPPYWEPLKRVFTVRVGDPATEPDFLDSRSPLFKADQIKCPLLIAQGANDPRVKQAESEQIVAALRNRGRDVEYILFEDEGHGFARPENRLKFYAAAERFLAKYLHGRAE